MGPVVTLEGDGFESMTWVTKWPAPEAPAALRLNQTFHNAPAKVCELDPPDQATRTVHQALADEVVYPGSDRAAGKVGASLDVRNDQQTGGLAEHEQNALLRRVERKRRGRERSGDNGGMASVFRCNFAEDKAICEPTSESCERAAHSSSPSERHLPHTSREMTPLVQTSAVLSAGKWCQGGVRKSFLDG